MSVPGPERRETEPDLDEVTATGEPGGRAAADAAAVLWRLLLEARQLGRQLRSEDAAVLTATSDGSIRSGPDSDALAELHFVDGRWQVAQCREAEALLALYVPLCAVSQSRPLVVAHLGQSLDGFTATASGDSNFVTGPANLEHLHRMRALADAIVVGAGTVEADDPRLTTRRVPGPSPTRIVIDPGRRLSPSYGVYSDGAAPTIILSAASEGAEPGGNGAANRPDGERRTPGVDCIAVPRSGGGLDLAFAVEALRRRGLWSLFVEGGGITVSSFVEAGLVDRLQIAVAPLLTGAGRPALALPGRVSIAECLRPASRVFAMGDDVLFDCDLRTSAADAGGAGLPRRLG